MTFSKKSTKGWTFWLLKAKISYFREFKNSHSEVRIAFHIFKVKFQPLKYRVKDLNGILKEINEQGFLSFNSLPLNSRIPIINSTFEYEIIDAWLQLIAESWGISQAQYYHAERCVIIEDHTNTLFNIFGSNYLIKCIYNLKFLCKNLTKTF